MEVLPLAQHVQMHPVYRAINKPLTIWGVERRLFFLALVIGGATFNYFGSLISGIAMFVGLYGAARWTTATDMQMIRILLSARRCRAEYDPGKRDPFEIEVLPQ
jgi:type IV secretory pathway TrbD component